MPRLISRAWWVLLAVGLAGCASQGVQLPQSPLLAALERKSGVIAYVGTDNNIYTIDQSGGNLQAITEDASAGEQLYDLPTWSPDGRLAYIGLATPEDGRAEGVIFATGEQGQANEVYRSDQYLPFYLYWSPDGQWLSFLSSSGIAQVPLALQLAPAQGGEIALLDTGRPYYWDWSPQERRLLVHAGGSAQSNPGSAKLAFLDMLDPVVETGVRIAPANFQAPAYSADGSLLLFAGEIEAGRQSLLLADSGGAVRASVAEFEGNIAFGWPRQGNYAAYILGRAGEGPVIGKLSLVDVSDPSAPETTELEAEQVAGFFWAPDGKQLAYFVPVLVRPGTAQGEQAQSTAEGEIHLQMHMVQARSGQSKSITTFRPSERFLDMVFNFDQYQRSATIWSPDSRYLVVPATDGQQQGLFVVPASGDFEPRFLTEGVLAFWSWE